MEAMSCGIPTVAANTATAPEILSNDGLLFKPRDPQDLADKIMEALQNNELRNDLSLRSRERVMKFFTAEKMARKYLELYKSLLS